MTRLSYLVGMALSVLIYKIQIDTYAKWDYPLDKATQLSCVIDANFKCYCVANAIMLIRVHSCSRLLFVVCIGIRSILVLYRANCSLIQIVKENHIIKHIGI